MAGAILPADYEPEARVWLKAARPQDLESRRLVYRLYDAGALVVGVVFLEGDPAGFRVYLPEDIDRRAAIFERINGYLSRAGSFPERDIGQDAVTLWFQQETQESDPASAENSGFSQE